MNNNPNCQYKYGELIECIEKMNFIKKEMKKIPKAEKYFSNAMEWLNLNKEEIIDKNCDYWYMRGSYGNMFNN